MQQHFESNDKMRPTKTFNIDEQLSLMNTINTMVKNGQFTAQLANTIFSLCAALKTSGQMLENTHKSELNKVFISLRQACCRDNGQLGTPCRLKMMELVELRAMHWRSNLTHSQYYQNRPDQQPDPPQTPTSHSPFGPSNNMFMPQEPSNNHGGGPGFYLIPTSGWMPPVLPGMGGMGGMGMAMGGMPPNPFMQQPMMPPEALLMRQRSLKKPSSQKPMIRHEMIIRNSDSGKIMGVKGRRVALVEQLTNTVISFQKVDPKSKERTLTITASSMEDVVRAQDLIIDTIRRNVSPIRMDSNHSVPGLSAAEAEEDEDDDENEISIETTQDGILKLTCADPQVLQAAQEALSEYLRVRARPSAEEREKKKERRKSMPLQQSQNEPTIKPSRSFMGSTPNLAETPSEKKTGGSTSYSRETVLGLRDTTAGEATKTARELVANVAPEILRTA